MKESRWHWQAHREYQQPQASAAPQLRVPGLVKQQDAKVDAYVTRKALDGLFTMVAEEERAIRRNPAAAAGSLAKRVFAALGR